MCFEFEFSLFLLCHHLVIDVTDQCDYDVENDDIQIKDFVNLAEELELDYLIEVHDLDELKRVQAYKNAIIGVNNRNLKTFEVDLNNSINLREEFQSDNIFVAESGIKNQSDIDLLKENNIHVFLIGESLMRGDFA